MIKLREPGERGGVLVATASIFDILSLQEMCTAAHTHYTERLEKYKLKVGENPDSGEQEMIRMVEFKIKDAAANLAELERVQEDREEWFNAQDRGGVSV